jgi:hypothetical protein
MNLEETLRLSSIAAGSPGSGRHSGDGSATPANKAIHNFLTTNGWKHKPLADGDSTYSHSKHGTITVESEPGALWEHTPAKSDRSNHGQSDYGSGTLKEYAKGGFGKNGGY